MKFFNLYLFLVLILSPQIIFAQIKINEIMYDLDGTDSGREWVEFYNTGDSVDLSEYRFLENNVNHTLKVYEYSGNPENTTNIKSGEYSIISDNPGKFLIDYPEYSGILLDSAFSLSNQGENIAIVDSENNIIHSVNYSPEWGAKGTGGTLQLKEGSNDNYIPATPTPGYVNSNVIETEPDEDETDSDSSQNNSSSDTNNNTSDSSHSNQNPLTFETETVNLEIGAGRNRYGIINSPLKFKAISNSDKNSKIDYEWSFGDAGSKTGTKPKYTYYKEGEYNVVLNAEYKEEEATTRTKVIIRNPEINIKLITSGKAVDILLENQSNFEVNLGGFYFILKDKNHKDQIFTIPGDTIVDAKSSILIANDITEFKFKNINTIYMYYPNGKYVDEFLYIIV
jgi:hypothetical protein